MFRYCGPPLELGPADVNGAVSAAGELLSNTEAESLREGASHKMANRLDSFATQFANYCWAPEVLFDKEVSNPPENPRLKLHIHKKRFNALSRLCLKLFQHHRRTLGGPFGRNY